jgi:hypothetical protein
MPSRHPKKKIEDNSNLVFGGKSLAGLALDFSGLDLIIF